MSVQAHCAVCGDVKLKPQQVTLAPADTGIDYSWWCPTCREHTARPAKPELVALLVLGGVVLSDLAPEYAQHDGPEITQADLDVFRDDLRAVQWTCVQAETDKHQAPLAGAGGAS